MTLSDAFVPSALSDETDWFADERAAVPALTYDRTDAVNAVLDAYLDAHEPNWDGEGGLAVSGAALEWACRFVLSLPDGTPEPEPDASPRGTVLFEWYGSPYWRLAVDVAADGTLAYSALLGRGRRRGTDVLTETVPADVLDLANRVVGWS